MPATHIEDVATPLSDAEINDFLASSDADTKVFVRRLLIERDELRSQLPGHSGVSMRRDLGNPTIASAGEHAIVACVPNDWDNNRVKAFVDATVLSPSIGGWVVKDTAAFGVPERVPCARRSGYTHIVLSAEGS